MNEHTLEAFGACGALAFRQGREGAGWWVGELRAGTNSLQLVEVGAVQAIDGDQMEIIGRATIAPLVARLLEGIRTGATPAPSLEDGLRAQAVLDAVLASASRGGWVEVS
jgi:predicted dehydrogenase